jgi:predicted RNA-binding protein
MCLSKAYLRRNGERELLMEQVTSVDVTDDKLVLKTLFGEQKELVGKLRQVDFIASAIILEEVTGK